MSAGSPIPAGHTQGAHGASLPADYHTHTYRCGHAVGTAADYVDAALARGLAGIGVCDHLPLIGRRDAGITMDVADLDEYVQEVLALRRTHPDYVLLGIEADYEPETIDEVRGLLDSYPFDYVIGSVHFLDGWGFDNPEHAEGWDTHHVSDIYLRYFELVGEAAESGAFTVLGHLDLVKKLGHRPRRQPWKAMQVLVDRIARAGVTVEINTAGLRKPVAEMYPSADFLGLLRRGGVQLTFGSDAHRPEEVGTDFAAAVALARSAGYTEYVHLEPREKAGRARFTTRSLPNLPPDPAIPTEPGGTTLVTGTR